MFVELLRKNPVWTLSDFVKIQKFSSRIVQECASLHILERRVCRANTLLHRTIAIHGDSAMYVLVHCLATRFANRKSRFCLILPPSVADMHTLYSKTRAPHNTFFRFGFTAYRHGRRWFQTVVSFSIEKLIVEQCTRMYTVQQPAAAQPRRQNV